MAFNIRRFIETNFLIDDVSGKFVRFEFNPVQDKYWRELVHAYGESLDGVREEVLKARREGFTSLILGIFAALDIETRNATRTLEISYKDDATKQHFRRYKNFILSCFQSNTAKWDKSLEIKLFKSQSEGSELVLAHNQASFYVGTANVRTGERGGTVQRLLFTEHAHYPDTGILSAGEVIDATSQQVSVGMGMIFRETTANGFNHAYRSWDNAKRGISSYKPRFYGWREFYSQAQMDMLAKGFSDQKLLKQEYPENDIEAFLSSEDMVVISPDVVLRNVENRLAGVTDEALNRRTKRVTVCDPAGAGEDSDECVIYNLENTKIVDSDIFTGVKPMEVVGRILGMAKRNKSSVICIDKVGEGSGIFSRVEQVYKTDSSVEVYGFDGRLSPPEGLAKETYANYKTYAYFKARDIFIDLKANIPNDVSLISQLSSITYEFRNGRQAVTKKEDIKAKLGQSPDRADAYVMGLDALDRARYEYESEKLVQAGWCHPRFRPTNGGRVLEYA